VLLAAAAFIASGSVGYAAAERQSRDPFPMVMFYGLTNPLVWIGVFAVNCRINRYQCPHCAGWIERGKEVAAGELAGCSSCKKFCIKPPA
jgi:hypothetical protein